MFKRNNLPTDLVSILSIAFGAAVIVPSAISLALILVAIGDLLL